MVYWTLPVWYEVELSFEHLKPLCSDRHPYCISFPKESPQAITEPGIGKRSLSCILYLLFIDKLNWRQYQQKTCRKVKADRRERKSRVFTKRNPLKFTDWQQIDRFKCLTINKKIYEYFPNCATLREEQRTIVTCGYKL